MSGLGAEIDSHLADICDKESLDRALQESSAEIVFHLAAQSLVRQSYVDPLETYRTNVLGTAQILDSVRRAPAVKAVVVVTSDKCYENDGSDRNFSEDCPMGGHDPYSSSKGCAELVTSAFRRSFFDGRAAAGRPVAIASARAGNVIGPGDWAPDRIMTDLIAAAENKTVAMIRNPASIRPWQFVLEPLRGYLMLANALVDRGADYASGWNFGPREDDAISVSELADRVSNVLGHLEVDHGLQRNAAHEAQVLRLDSSKAGRLLAWKPVLPLSRAVDITVRGYQQISRSPAEANKMMRATLTSYWTDVDAAS